MFLLEHDMEFNKNFIRETNRFVGELRQENKRLKQIIKENNYA